MEKREYNTPRIITSFVSIVEVLLIGFKNFILKFGDAILQIGRIVFGFLISAVGVLGLLSVLTAAILLILTYTGTLDYVPFELKAISGSSFRDLVISISAAVLLIIPLIMVLSLGMLLLFKFYLLNKRVGLALGIIWLAAAMGFGFSMAMAVPNFAEEAEVINEKRMALPDGQLHFNLNERNFKSYPALDIQIFETEEDEIVIEERILAQGFSVEDAMENARGCKLTYSLEDSIFSIDRELILNKGQVFRAQRAYLRIGVPSGTHFTLNRKAFNELNHHHEIWTDYGSHHNYHHYSKGPFKIVDTQLKVLSNSDEAERSLYQVSGQIEVELRDENKAEIIFKNSESTNLEIFEDELGLNLKRALNSGDSSVCQIELNADLGPIKAFLSDGAILKASRFNRENSLIELQDASAELDLDRIDYLEVRVKSNSKLRLSGSAGHVVIYLDEGAAFEYSDLICPSVEIVKKN